LIGNAQLVFCLAKRTPTGAATTGIERRSTTVTSWSTNDNIKYYSLGGLDAWNANSYLNIWTGKLGGGLLGYATFPGGTLAKDGVVLLFSSVGSLASPSTLIANYNLGRTATHEVGHWFNLRHIWGDDGGACSGSDLVDDTPNQGSENYGCPAANKLSICTNTYEMWMNYMDYTDDRCMYMFSVG
jgi:hypothetical protein